MQSIRISHWASLAGLVVLVACGGGGDGTSPTVKGFSITLSSSSLSVQAGGSGTVTATIARTGEFSGTIDLSVESLPTGITASFAPSSITVSTSSTTLTVNAAASVVPGNYTFTIRGKSTGQTDRTGTVTVTVTAAPAYTMTLAPAALTIQAGASGQTTITLARTNFTAAVAVALEGAPTGVTGTFGATSITGDNTTLTINVAASAVVGTSTLTVRGTATGLDPRTATLSLTVTAPAAPAISLALTPTAASVQQGGTSSVAVAITRTNFDGAVTLAVTGAPNGVTAVITASPTTTNAATIALTVGAAVPAGTSTLTVTGSGTGISNATATFALTVTLPPSISLALTPTAATVGQGGTTSIAVAITRTNFPDAVTLAVTGAPAGVTPTITTSPTTTNAATIALGVGAAVPPGVYTLTVTGSGTGISNVTATFTLTVTAAPAITLNLSVNAATVQQGNNTTFTVDIARTNFTGAVTIAVTNAPAGVTSVITTSPTTGNSVSIQLNVGLATAVGLSTLTITGSGTGITTTSEDFKLTVTQAPAGSSVSWSFCGGSTQLPIWLAVSNDGGAFQHIVGVNNTYTFTIGTKGIVAYVTQSGADDFILTENYGALADLQGEATVHCPTPGTKNLIANVSGLSATTQDLATVSVGSGFGSATYISPTANVTGVPNGALDIVSTRTPSPVLGADFVANKVFIQRAQNLASGSSFPVDFNGANAFDPETNNLTFANGLAGDEFNATSVFFTATSSFGLLSSSQVLATTARTFLAVPDAKEIAGDLHILSAFATQKSGNTVIGSRGYTKYFKESPSALTITFGSALNVPTITNLASVPYARFRVQLTQQAEYSRSWTFDGTQVSGSFVRAVIFSGTPNYFGSGTIDFQVFDFTSVDGWNNQYGPNPGQEVTFSITAIGWTVQPGTDGSFLATATNHNKFTP